MADMSRTIPIYVMTSDDAVLEAAEAIKKKREAEANHISVNISVNISVLYEGAAKSLRRIELVVRTPCGPVSTSRISRLTLGELQYSLGQCVTELRTRYFDVDIPDDKVQRAFCAEFNRFRGGILAVGHGHRKR